MDHRALWFVENKCAPWSKTIFRCYFQEIMREAVGFMAQMKTPFYAWFAGALVLVIDHPDDVYTVLTSKSCMQKAAVYRFFNMGTSLFTAPGKYTTKFDRFIV